MKKILSLLLSLTLILGIISVPAMAEEKPINVYLNGTALTFDQPPVMQNDRTMVPMRAIFEALGYSVTWDEETESIHSVKDGIAFSMQINNNLVFVNDQQFELDVPPMLFNGRTLVPVRAVAELSGALVTWSDYANSVYIRNNNYFAAELEIENLGNITVLLAIGSAPYTVLNFCDLVESGFYNGLTFHRVIKDFMIQGGDPNGDGTGGSGTNIPGEFLANNVANYISHERGVISMARAQDFNSASSQFFIVHKDSTFLDGQYAAFGMVMDGMDVVDKIAETETNEADKPLAPVIIKSAKLLYDYDEEIEAFLAALEEETAPEEETVIASDATVYVTTKTKTYHYSSDCKKVDSAKAMTLENAIAKKYNPCEECVR